MLNTRQIFIQDYGDVDDKFILHATRDIFVVCIFIHMYTYFE